MKFIIDAQLPRKLERYLSNKGFDVIHTLDLPQGNKTQDSEISKISIEQQKILISKDSGFYINYLQKLEPFKLIYLTTGNISTNALLKIFEENYHKIFEEIEVNFVVEVSQTSIITII